MATDEVLQLARDLNAAFNYGGLFGGTDEEEIYRVLAYARDKKLTKALVDRYSAEYPGEMSIEEELDDELSGAEYDKAMELYRDGLTASAVSATPTSPATTTSSTGGPPTTCVGTVVPGCAAGPLSVSSTLNSIITNFSTQINSSRSTDRKLTEEGQFFCSGCLYDMALSVIDAHFPGGTPHPALRNDLKSLCKAYYDGNTAAIPPLETSVKAQLNSLGSTPAEIKTLLAKRGATATAEGLLQEFNRIGYFPDDKNKYANLELIGIISKREYIICGTLAQYAINRFYKQSGLSRPSESFGALLAISIKSDDPKKPKYKATRYYDWNGNTLRHDLVTYPDITSITRKIQLIKERLDHGYPFHARVLSGLGAGHGINKKVADAKTATSPPTPEAINVGEEHSIAIIGYDNNTFLFWDPDASTCRFQFDPTTQIKGFGTLTFQSGRLTTAATESDLFSDENGDHLSGTKNHRYQILTMYS